MRQKITDDQLREASKRHNAGETLANIASDMHIPYGSLVSAKRRRGEIWRDAIALNASSQERIASTIALNAPADILSYTEEIRGLRAEIHALSKQLDTCIAQISSLTSENEELTTALEKEKLAYQIYREHVSL